MPYYHTCPLCGGTAELQKESPFNRSRYRVTCSQCHCSTMPVFTGIDLLNGREITEAAARSRAVHLWEARAGAGSTDYNRHRKPAHQAQKIRA